MERSSALVTYHKSTTATSAQPKCTVHTCRCIEFAAPTFVKPHVTEVVLVRTGLPSRRVWTTPPFRTSKTSRGGEERGEKRWIFSVIDAPTDANCIVIFRVNGAYLVRRMQAVGCHCGGVVHRGVSVLPAIVVNNIDL